METATKSNQNNHINEISWKRRGKLKQVQTQPIQTFPQQINHQHTTKYLGCYLDIDSTFEEEYSYRTRQAQKAFHRLHNKWKDRNLTMTKKLELYNACVTSILLYGSEAQQYNQTQLQRLETFRMRHIRHITRTPSHLNHESNNDLQTRTKTSSVMQF